VDHQKAPPLPYESKELLALSAYVARQSRGLPIEPKIEARTKPFLDSGREAFHRRQGQLNLSCSQCHDDNWGKKLAGSVIPQAHPTGYPIYRLEWQNLGSLGGACATASSGFAPRSRSSAPTSSSTSSST